MALSTDFKDDILNESVNEKRKYQMTYNDDGTVSFTDVTSYTQTGSEYGAAEVNEERQAINELNSALMETENYCVNEHHAMYIRLKGYTKELIMLNTNGFTTTDDVNYGTVPEKYRPINPVNCWINLNGLAKAHLSISTNGIVRIYEATVDTPVGSHVAINHTFL